MKPWFYKVVALGLAVGFCLSAWKMFEFRDRLHAITDNGRWELTVTREVDAPILLFGDSQVELWPQAASFGALPVVNRGISGDWATRAVERFAREFSKVKPRAVVLLIGTNDLAHGEPEERIVNSIASMLSTAAGAQIIVCSVLPASGEYAVVRPTAAIRSLNARLQELAAATGSEYVDLFEVLADDSGAIVDRYTADGLHLSTEGYVLVSRVLLTKTSLIASHVPAQLRPEVK